MKELDTSRLDELEIHNAHLERKVDELSEIVYQHQKKMDSMEASIRQMTKRLREVPQNNAELPENEKPPHY